ncbi:MAG: TRAP transporter substrate-binding protein DctP [Rhodospirillaceae bacterium]|nr:TRAP transporter substrate-binding protein DctP [Rhodospirillaceae bacterium]
MPPLSRRAAGHLAATLCAASVLTGTTRAAATEIVVVGLTAPTGITRDRYTQLAERLPRTFAGGATVTVMVDGQAGSEEAMAGALRRGRAHFGQLTIPGIAAAAPEMAVLMAPYLFDSFDEEDFVLDRFVAPLATELLAARGLTFIGFSDSGWFVVFNRTALIAPEAARTQRLRAAGGDASRLFLAAVGADVAEMAFAELVPALQTGLVQGGVTNLIMYRTAGLVRAAPHVTLTRHAVNPGVSVANKAWFDALSPGNQALIRAAMGDHQQLRDGVRRECDEALAALAADGLVVHEPGAADLARWRAAGLSTHGELIRRLGGRAQELYDAIQAGKRAYEAATRASR